MVRFVAAASLCLLGCTQPGTGGAASELSAQPAFGLIASGAHERRLEEEEPQGSWAEAISLEQWAAARDAFDSVHPTPETAAQRYIRARIALELGDAKLALGLLDDLEAQLPDFADDIARYRTRAQFEVGPYQAAAESFAKRGGDLLIDAARAFVRAKQPERALETLDRALRETSKSDTRALAELLRLAAETAESTGDKTRAAQSYRRLTFELPTAAAAREADTAYERTASVKLSKQERYARAEAFTQAGQRDAVVRELELMSKAPGAPPPGVDVLRTRAWAEYKSRGDYHKASRLFAQAAQLDSSHRTQDLFFSARALSRANDDETAIERYLSLAKRVPSSSYAEQARYLAARLYLLLGRFREAALGYDDYERRYKSGRYLADARFERGLSRLALGNGKGALPDLERSIADARDDREKNHRRELFGVALAAAGKATAAAQQWETVIDDFPLSLSALFSAARLRAAGREPPPAIGGDEAPSLNLPEPLSIVLPGKVEKLFRWGFHAEAARELYALRSEFIEQHNPHGEQALCQAFGLFSTAELRFGYAHRVVPERVLMRPVTPETRWQWDCIYPSPYAAFVDEQEQLRAVPHGLVYAVMRQESAFKPGVRSPVGATGLMQLMPNTARQAARELGIEDDPKALVSPPYNIQLGTFYLGKVLEAFSGNVVMAAVAYNAGPAAVRRWLRGGQGLALDLWVARIPYDETRGYVRRVVGNWARYRYLAGGTAAVPNIDLALPEVSVASGSEY
jgi:soluble lytic murein transglycosylase